MPFYEYECSACKFYVEALQKISDPPMVKCPSCGKESLQRLISAPVFRLKGAGWYETDFKSDKENKRNLADTGADKEPAAPAQGDDKGEDKPAKVRARKTTKKAAAKVVGKKAKLSPKPKSKPKSMPASSKKVAKKKAAKKPGNSKSAKVKKPLAKFARKKAKKAARKK